MPTNPPTSREPLPPNPPAPSLPGERAHPIESDPDIRPPPDQIEVPPTEWIPPPPEPDPVSVSIR